MGRHGGLESPLGTDRAHFLREYPEQYSLERQLLPRSRTSFRDVFGLLAGHLRVACEEDFQAFPFGCQGFLCTKSLIDGYFQRIMSRQQFRILGDGPLYVVVTR